MIPRINLPLLLPLLAFAALAQKPVINPKGIVNAASFAGAEQPGLGIAPGSIASLFGQALSPRTRAADSLPLPRTLEGTSVTVDGLPAPLFYVSPTQINFQVPSALTDPAANKWPRQVPVVVTTPSGGSEPFPLQVVFQALGIFTQEGRGCGQGAILNVNADGSRTLNSPAQSASPGSFVSVYATGLGRVYWQPPDGQPAQTEPLARHPSGAFTALGPEDFARSFSRGVSYTGRAPGLVGADQIDFLLAPDAPEGCAVPLRLLAGSYFSQPVQISIHQGGGQCQDAPLARLGSLRWKQTVNTGPAPSARTTQETFTASFSEAPANHVVPPRLPSPRGGCDCYVGDPPFDGPRCAGTGLRGLNLGPLTLTGLPAGPLTVNPGSSFGEIAYAATLPAGAIRPGTVQVQATGGPEVGPFRTTLAIPPPIQITTPLAPGTVIPRWQPFRVTWTGGSPDAWVSMKLLIIDPIFPSRGIGCECTAVGSAGQVTLDVRREEFHGVIAYSLPVGYGPSRVVITVTPSPVQAATSFSAPGLSREATHEWEYEYRFEGLEIRPQPP